MSAKACIKCDRSLPLEAFYRHAAMADGRLNACKSCCKLKTRLHYRRTLAARRKYEQQRARQRDRRAAAAMSQRRTRGRNPEKYRARTAVGNAVRDGRLIKKPCSMCGTRRRVQAHHEDYSKPLDVRWLCFKCHREGEHGQRAA